MTKVMIIISAHVEHTVTGNCRKLPLDIGLSGELVGNWHSMVLGSRRDRASWRPHMRMHMIARGHEIAMKAAAVVAAHA